MRRATESLILNVKSGQVKTATGHLDTLSKSARRAEKSADDLDRKSAVLGRRMALLGGTILAGVSAQIVKTTRDWLRFNVAMNEVETIAGLSSSQFQTLRVEVLQLSTALGVDATQAAKGYYQAISAGVNANDAGKFVKQAALLARAGVTDIGSATDLLTTALNSYGLAASDAAEVSDQLFTTVKLGKTTIPELAQSFARASNVASSAGVELEELLGIVANLTKQGVPTAESFTQIKAAVNALLNPSLELEVIYKRLNVTGGRQLIQQKGLAGALNAVRDASADNDAVLVKALRSSEAYNGALGITGDKLRDTKKATDEIRNSTGATGEAFGKMEKDIGISIQRLQTSFVAFGENSKKWASDIDILVDSIDNLSGALADPDLGDNLIGMFEGIGVALLTGKTHAEQLNEEISRITLTPQFLEEMRLLKQLGEKDLPDIAQKLFEIRQKINFSESFNNNGQSQDRIDALRKQEELTLKFIRNLDVEKQQRIFIDTAVKTLNEKLRLGQITQSEYNEQLERTQNFYKENENSLNNWSNLLGKIGIDTERVSDQLSKWGGSVRTAVKPLLEAGARLNEINKLSLEAEVISEKLADKKLSKLEQQRDVLARLLEIRGNLTTAQQTALNILNGQIAAQRRLNAEAAKSPEQKAFESARDSLKTPAERAAERRDKAAAAINAGAGSEAERQEFLRRNNERFAKETKVRATRSFGGGGIDKAQQLAEQRQRELESLRASLLTEEESIEESYRKRLEIIKEATTLTQQERTDLETRLTAERNKQLERIEMERQRNTLNSTQDFFTDLQAASALFGKKGARIAKAAAIASATIDTARNAILAYQRGLEIPYAGVVLGPVFAATAIAAGAAQIAAIKSQPVGNYEQGGIIPGSSFTGDNLTANVNSGEMILNRQQQANLFRQANSPGGKGGVNITVNNNAPGVEIETRQGRDPKEIELIVKQAAKVVANDIKSGNGPVSSSLESTYQNVNRG